MINMKIQVEAKLKDLQSATYDAVERQGFDAEQMLCGTDFYDLLKLKLKKAGIDVIDEQDNDWTILVDIEIFDKCTKFSVKNEQDLADNCNACIEQNGKCLVEED